tara:strand:- start:238 stop:465 length:228 start_codon:yes stop_codon:yes gene_type:complete
MKRNKKIINPKLLTILGFLKNNNNNTKKMMIAASLGRFKPAPKNDPKLIDQVKSIRGLNAKNIRKKYQPAGCFDD